jgi:hypothetical protein
MISLTYLGIVCQHGQMAKKKIKMFKMKKDNHTDANFETFTIDKKLSNQ